MDKSARLKIIRRILKDVHFASLANHRDRIEYLLQSGLVHYQQLTSEVKINVETARRKSAKSLLMANNYLTEGKTFYSAAKLMNNKIQSGQAWDSALEAYVKAIRFTPRDKVKLLAKLYTHKSEAHYEKNEYDAALYSIDMAIEMDVSHTDKVKCSFFKINCLKMLGRYLEAIEMITTLSSEPQFEELQDKLLRDLMFDQEQEKAEKSDSKDELSLPFFSYMLYRECRIEQSPVVGRHYVAKQDIASDVPLLLEKPYSLVLESNILLTKCSNCYQDLGHKFYPCSYCTDLAFCDRKCFCQAYETFHRFECGILSLMNDMLMPAMHTFRMLSRVGPLEALKTEKSLSHYSIDDYLAESNQQNVPENEKSRDEKNRAYKMSSILWHCDDKQNTELNSYFIVTAIETAILLDLVHSMRLPESQFLLSFIELLLGAVYRIKFNSFSWNERDPTSNQIIKFGSCQCLVGSLVNHSCDPNTIWDVIDGQVAFVTKRPINKDEEITILYGPNKNWSYRKRQTFLNYYSFGCKCDICCSDACKGDNLRCRNCSGPVVFNSPLNLQNKLNGKCLLCYVKYEHFEQSIAELCATKNSIKSIGSLTLMLPKRDFFEVIIEQARKIVDLSLTQSDSISSCIVTSSQTVQRLAIQLKQCTLPEQVDLIVFFDRHLPIQFPPDLVDGKIHSNMQFWLRSALCIIGQFTSCSAINSPKEVVALWNSMFSYHYRVQQLQQSIRSLDIGNQMYDQKAIYIEDKWHNQLQHAMDEYGKHLQFKMLCNRWWAKLKYEDET